MVIRFSKLRILEDTQWVQFTIYFLPEVTTRLFFPYLVKW